MNSATFSYQSYADGHNTSSLSPLGRVGAADDIGGVIAFLCTDNARWINGQRIEVSGGING